MSDSPVVFRWRQWLRFTPELPTGSERLRLAQKALNDHHQWPGWTSLDRGSGDPPPPPALVDAHSEMHRSIDLPIAVELHADGRTVFRLVELPHD